ncbi:unnamed protein product [Arctia plantaginis]|uniref:Uncharacterized protein n=1 Tax=Arctia plantaginis TaxID=874455 RepID=A0A8S0ZEF7_ARCPL|nr:unnamed protein product [Arctia plantaginis]CAB3237471.1 unnamed protein product [Arctia plantaginis]
MEYFRGLFIFFFVTSSMAFEKFIIYDSGTDSNGTDGSDGNDTVTCVREHLYDRMNIKEVYGKWKVLELYLHLSNEGVNEYKSCPVVNIWEEAQFPSTTFGPSTENQLFHVQHINAKFRQEYRHLRVLWDEGGNTIEYSLYFKNDSAGYWQVFDGQNGTLTTLSKYKQFSGTIQVLKAANDHLVLNFCQEGVSGKSAQLYSVLFSREPGVMERWELDSVHSMLQNKKLSIASRRMVCGNSAEKPVVSIVSSVIMFLLAYTIGLS